MMVFRAFLELARDLADRPDEASWRTAISRAYYAAFHVARDLLHALGFYIPRAQTAHAYLWLRLSNSSVEEVNVAGRDLNDLRHDRNRADYQEKPVPSQQLAMDSIRLAEATISILDRVKHEPLRSHVTEAIKKYERDVLKETTWRA